MSLAQNPPHFTNRRIHPGLRHRSRLWTKPEPYKRLKDNYPDVQLKLIHNHANIHPQALILLNESKNIFSKQLPNMGNDYITRLVFDFEAETVMLLHKGIPMGGICGRLFPVEMFLEIAFCAVSTELQSSGYGRLAMNYLKTVLQAEEFYDILTCADNEAVVFFKKQGFNNKLIDMDPARWVGRIKDYNFVTLVHCHLYPDVDYMKFNETIADQIKSVEDLTGKRLHSPLFQASYWIPFAQSPTFYNMHLYDLTSELNNKKQKKNNEKYWKKVGSLRNKLMRIITELKNDERFGQIFASPVTEEIAPHYFETIKKPMDLRTMERRLLRFKDYYKNPKVFAADVSLMVENCKKYNGANTPFYKAALQAHQKFMQLYAEEFP
ncbi:acetyltransferase, GNAT family protein [Histomonas meleagridis]|uniref:acetyltransferase, GNAT family protein n=1 Tax=Histomonas meleagridis TaxID=135588 RepID=UPI003559BAA7|nr:acetyltransferase, GNAT family protein [Histomonas meleagridis]KAH0803394.1 acetyltransferase, GNAT family protein [Histomonas meleagridis]